MVFKAPRKCKCNRCEKGMLGWETRQISPRNVRFEDAVGVIATQKQRDDFSRWLADREDPIVPGYYSQIMTDPNLWLAEGGRISPRSLIYVFST